MDFDQFSDVLDWPAFAGVLDGASDIAVAVSGGGDSMALTRLLARWAVSRGVRVHALTVDHGLRAEAGAEAVQVGEWLAGLKGLEHHVLAWEGDKPEAGVQEEARRSRYRLMADYCGARGIAVLFVGHHRDDQAETVLFRLAKGSGLKGLGGMRAVHDFDDRLKLLRPLLDFDKTDIVDFCVAEGVQFVDDPSNADDQYARVRLRQAADVLAEEGLSAKRLSVTARRIARADEALEGIADKVFDEIAVVNMLRIVFDLCLWGEQSEEIALRLIIKAFERLGEVRDYLPRMEKIEDLCRDLMHQESFRKRTLGGLIFERNDARGQIVISPE